MVELIDPATIISQIGNIALWLQTLGIIIVFWIIFNIINLLINRKRIKEIYKIKDNMDRIESKIDSLIKTNQRNKKNN